jgi:hypothetical protein
LITKFYSALKFKRDEGAERVEVWKKGERMHELLWKPEVKRSMGRCWCKCKGKYKIDLQFTVWE